MLTLLWWCYHKKKLLSFIILLITTRVSAIKLFVPTAVHFCTTEFKWTWKPVPVCMVYVKVLLRLIQFINIFLCILPMWCWPWDGCKKTKTNILNATVSQVDKTLPSYCLTSKFCDLIIFSDTTDPTEHLGCMIHASCFFVLFFAGLYIELQVKLVFLLSW